MANLYGVANPNPPPTQTLTIGGVDISVPAGPETNVVSAAAPLPTLPGWFYPAFWGYLTISFGATPPTGLGINCRLNGGADLQSASTAAQLYIASTTVIFPFNFYAEGTNIQNPTGVWNFQISVVSLTQGVTVRTNGSYVNLQWIRATDQ